MPSIVKKVDGVDNFNNLSVCHGMKKVENRCVIGREERRRGEWRVRRGEGVREEGATTLPPFFHGHFCRLDAESQVHQADLDQVIHRAERIK